MTTDIVVSHRKGRKTRKTTVTAHRNYEQIAAAVHRGDEDYVSIAKRFGVSRHAVRRHFGPRELYVNNGNGKTPADLEARIAKLDAMLSELKSQRDEAKPKVKPESNNHDPGRLRGEAFRWYLEADELAAERDAFLVEHGGAPTQDPHVLEREHGAHVYEKWTRLRDESRKLKDRADERLKKAERYEVEIDNAWALSLPLGEGEEQNIGDELERLDAKISRAATDPIDDHLKPGRIGHLEEERALVIERLQFHFAERLAQRRRERIKWEAKLKEEREAQHA